MKMEHSLEFIFSMLKRGMIESLAPIKRQSVGCTLSQISSEMIRIKYNDKVKCIQICCKFTQF